MIAVIKSTAPHVIFVKRLPILPNRPVILSRPQISPILEQVQVNGKPLLVCAPGAPVNALYAHFPVGSGITEGIAQRTLVARCLDVTQQIPKVPGKLALGIT